MDCLSEYFQNNYSTLISNAMAIIAGNNEIEASALVNNVYLKVYNQIAKGSNDLNQCTNLSAYLYRAMRNCFLDEIQRHNKYYFIPIDNIQLNLLNEVPDFELRDYLEYFLKIVPNSPIERKYLHLRFKGYKKREIESELGISEYEARKIWQRIVVRVRKWKSAQMGTVPQKKRSRIH